MAAPAAERPAAAAPVAAAWQRMVARLRLVGKGAVAISMTHSGRLLAAAVAIAALGWVGGTQTDVNADIRELLPSDLQALEDAEELERGAGVSGEIDVTVTAEDLTDPEVVAWMADYKRRVLERAGSRSRATSASTRTRGSARRSRFPTSSPEPRRRRRSGCAASSSCCRATSRRR